MLSHDSLPKSFQVWCSKFFGFSVSLLLTFFGGSQTNLSAQATVGETSAALNPIYVDVDNVSGSEDGTQANPYNTIAEALDVLSSNSSTDYKVIIADGTYREGSLTLHDRSGVSVVEGESRGGVILSGSDVWTGWTQDGSNWYKAWTEDWGLGSISFEDDPEDDLGRRAEMVFQDGYILRQVEALADMADGTYFVDESADRLYVRPSGGVDPSTVTLEVAVRTNLFFSFADDDLVIRNLTFQHAASGLSSGVTGQTFIIGGDSDDDAAEDNIYFESEPINGKPDRNFSENILIENCIFRWNNGGGASVNNSKFVTIRDSEFIFNGSSGLGVSITQNSEYIDSKFNYNNWRKGLLGGLYGWAPAGTKTLFADQLLIRGCEFIGNHATGLWMDFGSTDVTVFDSIMLHNWSQGFYNEANYGPVSGSSLLVRNNGYWPNEDGEVGGGIYFAESRAFSISDSYIVDNAYYGLGYRNRSRLSTAYWSGSSYDSVDTFDGVSSDMNFYNNTVVADRMENQARWDNEAKRNANAISLVSDGTLNWESVSIPSYSGDFNTYYSPHTTEIFTDGSGDEFGFLEVDLDGWKTDTGQESSSTWDADWQDGLDFDAYQESDGLIVFEAEHYHDSDKGTDSEIWQMKHGLFGDHLNHEGSGYLEPPVNATTGDADSAKVTYRFYVETGGTYHLAVRRNAASASDDSAFVYLNGTLIGDPDTLLSGATSGWEWKRADTSLGSLSSGLHTLEIVRREDGFAIDRIAVADDVSKLPVDGSDSQGPEVSLHGRPLSSDDVISITAQDAILRESDGPAVYRLSRSGIDGDVTVNLSIGGTATQGVDYVLPATTAIISDGTSFVDIEISFLDDDVAEASKTVSVEVISGSGYSVGAPATATVTQPANDLLSIEEVDIKQEVGNQQTFTLRISNPFAEDITFDLQDTGKEPLEHVWVEETYVWNDISTTASNAIAALDDHDEEIGVSVSLTEGDFRHFTQRDYSTADVHSNGVLNFLSFVPTITDQNSPLPTQDVSGQLIAGFWDDLETNTNTNGDSRIYEAVVGDQHIFQFEQLSNKRGETATFQIVLDYNSSGTSDDDEVVLFFKDVESSGPTHTIGAQGSALSRDGTFTAAGGALYAHNEVRVQDLSGIRLVDIPFWFDLEQDDLQITVPAGESYDLEFSMDTTGLPVGVILERTFEIEPTDDTIESTPLAIRLETAAGAGKLTLDTASFSLSEEAGTATVEVSRADGSLGAVSIDYATIDGTAVAGTQYTATSGTLTWADGESGTKTINIPIIDRSEIEPTATFTLALSDPSGGILLPAPYSTDVSILESEPNTAPVITVNRPTGTIVVEELSTALFLDVSVSDDGIPASLTYTWEQVSGPGTATFDDSSAEDTSVTFDAAGEYVIRLTADDSALTDTVDITVYSDAPDESAPTEGLLMYYPLDSTSGDRFFDSSGNNYNANVKNSSGTSWGAGVVNNAFFFPGNSSARWNYSSAFFDTTESAGLSVACWVRADSTSGNERFIFVQIIGDGEELLSLTSDRRIRSDLGGAVTQTAANTITIGQWHHLALTAGGGEIKIYIDGVERASRSDTIESHNGIYQIGNGQSASSSAAWDGGIDEFYVYHDTLTAQEVLILHGSAFDDANLAPEPSTGPSQQVVAGGSITLAGSATDDGIPSSPGVLSYKWQQVSGPGTATFTDTTDPTTSVTLPSKGDYEFRLIADDGEIASARSVTHSATGNPGNLSASEINGTSALLSWDDDVGESGYQVWLRAPGNAEWTFVTDEVAADSTSYEVVGLERGLSYEFLVEAIFGENAVDGTETNLTLAEGFIQQSTSPHLVVIEAEDYTSWNKNGSTDGWFLATSFSGSSGSGAMQTGSDDGDEYISNIETSAPYMTFEVYFETTGTHYLHILARAHLQHGMSNSLHAGLNDAVSSTAENVSKKSDGTDLGTSFDWISRLENNDRATVNIPSVGLHSIQIWPREDGTLVDKLLLTTDANYVPSGDESLTVGKPRGSLTAIEYWRDRIWLNSASEGDGADSANPDGDSLTNIAEFALGGNPLVNDSAELLPKFSRVSENGTDYFEFSFRRRLGSSNEEHDVLYTADGVVYSLESRQNLDSLNWETATDTLSQVGAPVYNDDGTETVRFRHPLGGTSTMFFRLDLDEED